MNDSLGTAVAPSSMGGTNDRRQHNWQNMLSARYGIHANEQEYKKSERIDQIDFFMLAIFFSLVKFETNIFHILLIKA